jgi:hypothetical protein
VPPRTHAAQHAGGAPFTPTHLLFTQDAQVSDEKVSGALQVLSSDSLHIDAFLLIDAVPLVEENEGVGFPDAFAAK